MPGMWQTSQCFIYSLGLGGCQNSHLKDLSSIPAHILGLNKCPADTPSTLQAVIVSQLFRVKEQVAK